MRIDAAFAEGVLTERRLSSEYHGRISKLKKKKTHTPFAEGADVTCFVTTSGGNPILVRCNSAREFVTFRLCISSCLNDQERDHQHRAHANFYIRQLHHM